MSVGFSINDILGNGGKPTAPAGQKMQVVMLPAADIEPNPENSIYEIVACAARWKSCPPRVASTCCWPGTGAGLPAVP